LDDKLEEALASLTLDVEGRLIQSLSLRGIFRSFESTWKDFIMEWLDTCSASGTLDWYLYGKFVEAWVDILNRIASISLGLMEHSPIDNLPSFSAYNLVDSDTTYDAVMSWLRTKNIQDISSELLRDLQSQRNMTRMFPSDAFVDHLYDLTILLTERQVDSEPNNNFYLLKTELASALQQVEGIIDTHAADLRRTFALRARRSPKRRSSFAESDTSGFSTPSKRRKISISNPSSPSDGASQSSSPLYIHHLSPSPTASVSTAPPDTGVTIAMLRALTRDVKAKYGGSPLAK